MFKISGGGIVGIGGFWVGSRVMYWAPQTQKYEGFFVSICASLACTCVIHTCMKGVCQGEYASIYLEK